MMETIVLKEYDQLHIRAKRDAGNHTVTLEDALALQRIVMEDEPVFKWGYKKLTAQHWVGTISLKGLNIEILPKLYGHVSTDSLRIVLMRMITVSHQAPAVREMPGMAWMRKDSLIEMLIGTYLGVLETYVKEGLQHSYQTVSQNINRVKGKILFGKQFSRNVLDPAKFWCSYSKFTADNDVNRFMKVCLHQMDILTRDSQNKRRIKYLLPAFDRISLISKERALARPIVFHSANHRAAEAYRYGLLFLKNIFSTLSAGNTAISMMLFNMNELYELFIYRVAKIVYGSHTAYQMRGNYLLARDTDGRKYVGLRPDIAIKTATGELDIIDTKWKIPKRFAKESDAYQMNAYSSSIQNVGRVFLLYPHVENQDMVGDYHFAGLGGRTRTLKIRTVNLLDVLDWKKFIRDFKDIFV
ncbi:MAG: McrC family protein [Oscillospiraceae bacterium]|nr:McrC family protein [Oscillospiraceae bacterium]